MTLVTLVRDANGALTAIRTEGHTGFADAGEDIVCAAISALVQTAAIALEKRGGSVKIQEEPAQCEVALAKGMTPREREEAVTVLGAVADGLRSMELGYANYITLREV